MALADIFPKEFNSGDKYGFDEYAEARADADYIMITGLKKHFKSPHELFEVEIDTDNSNPETIKYTSLEGKITTEVTKSQDEIIRSIFTKEPKTSTYKSGSNRSVIYIGRIRVVICSPHWYFKKIKNL